MTDTPNTAAYVTDIYAALPGAGARTYRVETQHPVVDFVEASAALAAHLGHGVPTEAIRDVRQQGMQRTAADKAAHPQPVKPRWRR